MSGAGFRPFLATLLAVPVLTAAPQTSGRMTDAQAQELAESLLRTDDAKTLTEGLKKLKGHVFKSSKAPQREVVLFAQGMALWKTGRVEDAAEPFKKLEATFPKSAFLGEAQLPLAEEALLRKRMKECETRLRASLDSDIPGERKRRAQELMLWLLVETGRPQEGLPILDTLRPLEKDAEPSEQGLAAMVIILCEAKRKDEAEANRRSFHNLYEKGPLTPRVDLAWCQMLGRSNDPRGSAQAFRKLITDFPKSPEADEARLALATLLTDGSLKGKDLKGMPDAESLLAELRKGGSAGDEALAGVVEMRILYRKEQWEDILKRGDAWMAQYGEKGVPAQVAEVRRLWKDAWGLWVDSRLEKGYAGVMLERMRAGAFAALGPKQRLGVAELLAKQGLAADLPRLIREAPQPERGPLAQAALAKVEPEAQPKGVLALLPAKGTPAQELLRLRAQVTLQDWKGVRASAPRAQAGPERIRAVTSLLQRPFAKGETAAQRRAEAEGWLGRLSESADAKEPLLIRVADLRSQTGDYRGALALYPLKPAPAQLGWVSLMRAQAQLRLGQRDAAKATLQAAKGVDGFRGQRDALEKSLGI
ncbi:MAG TPA: tetratricopeptide repeat protein [Holophagaceae bacterium]|nr:tetratricopeptide repeat protein [Holophagaceae bacterium]